MAGLLLRMPASSRRTASQSEWPIAPKTLRWPDGCGRWPRAVPVGPVLSHELCAIFVCIFNLYITVFMLQLYLSENYRNLPLFPWHILALRSEYSFHLCVCMFAHALVVFKTVSICLLQPQHPKSHLNGKRVHMCACVHTHAGGGDQASREAAYSRVRRPVLCTLPVRNLGSPHPPAQSHLKAKTDCAVLLGWHHSGLGHF